MSWEELINECAAIARGVAYDPNIKQSELYHEIASRVAERVSFWEGDPSPAATADGTPSHGEEGRDDREQEHRD